MHDLPYILKVKNLSIGIYNENTIIPLIEDINFELKEKETFGLIGESGCGKTITAMGITGLKPEPNGIWISGNIFLNKEGNFIDILQLHQEELRALRGAEISVIFQEPFMALNPLYTIEFHFYELYKFHKELISRKGIDFSKRMYQLLKRVGFSEPERILKSYPHQLSGGMLQRIVIILSLLLKPKLIIADEPTTALDVTIQAQIMNLLMELKEEENTSVLLITHNMGLLAQYADRLAVMYAGRIVELTDIDTFLQNPLHPYSQGLLEAIPELEKDKPIKGIPGSVPTPDKFSHSCRFQNRCPYQFDLCNQKPIPIVIEKQHTVYCWKYQNSPSQ